MSHNELPPLPDTIAKDMQSLRSVEPSSALVERAMANLSDRSSEQTTSSSRGSTRERVSSKRSSVLVFLIPAVAIVAAILLFAGKFGLRPQNAVVRVEEKTLSLPETGHAWTALDLQTQHHANEPALVHIEVPTNVRVRIPAANGVEGDADEKHCAESRCVHRFTQHHGRGVPVRIAVTHPGRYDIHVRHESRVAAMREHFVVTANRD